MKKKIFLIRTYVPVGTLGPIPPLELLYSATQIEQHFKDYSLKVTDMGIGDKSIEEIKCEIKDFMPDVICLNAYAWEAKLVHDVASVAKAIRPDIINVVLGQLASIAKENLVLDKNINYVVVGESEITFKELLSALEGQLKIGDVDGLIHKTGNKTITNAPRFYPEDIDDISISPSAWDLIKIKEYAKYANWNGALKEDFYIPILTSRGCPFPCKFCRETYGKAFLSRTPENVVSEIQMLHGKYGVKEFHIYDSVFNYDVKRAKRICELIIKSGLKISLAFPHGIRADIMTDELIVLLKKAGTYKLVYGIETASPRIQKSIRKNLNLSQVRAVIQKTSQAGIIVGGYFMLGHDTETEEEMNQTIDYAVSSDLDNASFFKAMDYDDLNKIYQKNKISGKIDGALPYSFEDLGYYSVKRSQCQMSPEMLNSMVLKAQRKFYLNLKRIVRGVKKAPRKGLYLMNLVRALSIIMQGYIMEMLKRECHSKNIEAGTVAQN